MRGAVATRGEQLWRIADLSRRFDIPTHTIHKMWRKKAFPAPLQIGPRLLRWRESDVSKWTRPTAKVGKTLVYFVRAGNHVKIGVTSNLDNRLKSIQTGCPAKIELIKAIPGTPDDERSFHRRFRPHRAIGEWYEVKDDLAAYLGLLK